MNFSDRLKQARDEKNLTQHQLADLSGITNITICNYERGEGSPTIKTLLKLEEVLKLHRGALIGVDAESISKKDVNGIIKEALKKIKKY